jgi:Cu/Ag efflux protein CusF
MQSMNLLENKSMKTSHPILLCLLAALSMPHAWAQTPRAANPVQQSASNPINTVSLTQGVVKKIDIATQKITLQHGEIKNLSMPAMTMVFRVKDKAALEKLKAGDKVRFHTEESDGGLLLTRIEKDAP